MHIDPPVSEVIDVAPWKNNHNFPHNSSVGGWINTVVMAMS